MSAPILSTRGLSRSFAVGGGWFSPRRIVQAVSGVDIALGAGRTLGLVGESGSGKTTLSRLLLRLETPTSGSIAFEGEDLAAAAPDRIAAFRRAVQPVFQNPYASLDPRMRIGAIVGEPLRAAGFSGPDIAARVARALEAVGLAAEDASKLPNAFSGGQRQRIAIARAVAAEARLIILDEPVSSQDVSIRAQILNLLKDLQADLGLAYLFIAHDLASVRYMSDEIAVMYLGRIVEQGPADALCDNPQHPYTRALFAACLPDDPDARRVPADLRGEPPSPLDPPPGCPLHPRCPLAIAQCRSITPTLQDRGGGQRVACHVAGPAPT